jgi:hypothetical protein
MRWGTRATAANRVDGLTGFFTREVRLSHHCTLRFLRAGQAGLVYSGSLSCGDTFSGCFQSSQMQYLSLLRCLARGTETRFKLRQRLIPKRYAQAGRTRTKRMRLLTILIFLGLVTSTSGQGYYYYKPWKKVNINNTEIILTIDSIKSEDGKTFLTEFANQLSEQLNTLRHKCSLHHIKSIEDKGAVVIKLSLLEPAYVKLQTFQGQIPLCNRVTFEQTSPLSKKMIKTIINISVDKQDEAMEPLVDDLAARIDKQITKN